MTLAQEEGVDLTGDQLEAISGGDAWGTTKAFVSDCPKCGKYDIEFWYTDSYGDRIYKCANCGNIIKE